MKRRGIFVKVFLYTMLFLVLVISVTAVLFAQQIVSFYNRTQIRLLSRDFSTLTEQLAGAEANNYFRIAQEFSDKNESFDFELHDPDGLTVFSSIRITHAEGATRYQHMMVSVGAGYTLSASTETLDAAEYSHLINRILVGLAALLALGVLGSAVFARQMTGPIKGLVENAKTMAMLAPVSAPAPRNDEIGELSDIVHAMYGKLKDTIADLEEEKEAQRYFFAAASHELKTPIAATTVLLQGMLDDIGDYKNHPKYLWECIKLMKEQNKMITELLDIMKLTDQKIRPTLERVSLRRAATDMLASCQALIDKKEQRVEVEIAENQVVMADEKMLNRALSNVMINAVQNTRQNGMIRVWSEPAGDQIRLCVLNTGARIDESVLPKLFDPFFRVDEARSASHGRSGLGLTIVAKTLESMGLPYALENVPEGVVFWVDIPHAL